MGCGQALNLGLALSSTPNARADAELLHDPTAAKCDLALLCLSCGNKNGLINVLGGAAR
jgi:hypothetical protein